MTAADVASALDAARERLLAERVPAGHWQGELSSSALSTATAAAALKLSGEEGLALRGLAWLADHQNPDGGFGDTTTSPSNISTTALAWAALGMSPAFESAGGRASAWLKDRAGGLQAEAIARAIFGRYGPDKTFSVPILTMCLLAGRWGPEAWGSIEALPFELAALPSFLFRWMNLQVVSYALPALVALGIVHYRRCPTWNPLRWAAQKKALNLLESIQPESGGFLEATPLTSFVTMSLVAAGERARPSVVKAIGFLKRSVRPDGSWPIDTNLATWVTTLAVDALGGSFPGRETVRSWLVSQQTTRLHPYTRAAPGGWAWTHLSGGVPDADDTAGALLALDRLGEADGTPAAARRGVRWLMGLQNKDGGVPTFCRGWGKLPFDRSSPDLTAHALRAWAAWADRPFLPQQDRRRIRSAMSQAVRYLVRSQRQDGSWIPLWFGNQATPDEANPIYGTSRVLLAAGLSEDPGWKKAVERAKRWLVSAQQPDGGFGTIEETALAAQALAGAPEAARACRWLVVKTDGGTRFEAAPIGLYFARLWYSEQLYPVIFTVAALERQRSLG